MKNMRKDGPLLALLLALPVLVFFAAPASVPTSGEADLTVEERPMVALTFDDGPRRSTTAALLDGLAQRGVKATFFLIGEQLEGNEDLVKRMEEEGHQIGIHSFGHKWLTDLSAADFAREVDREREMLSSLLGRDDFLLRPPYGGVDNAVEKRAGSPIILWSVDPEDWKDQDQARVTEHILKEAKDGDILLLHDIYPSSVEAALAVVDALHQKGFLFVTVDELARQRGVELKAGAVYRAFPP